MIRPIRPEDEPLIAAFHTTLSERSVYLRYLQALNLSQRTQHDRLARMCFIDYDREIALVAERPNDRTGEPEIIGVARITKQHNRPRAQFNMIVSDRFQGQGIGRRLSRMIEVAKQEGIDRAVRRGRAGEQRHDPAVGEARLYDARGRRAAGAGDAGAVRHKEKKHNTEAHRFRDIEERRRGDAVASPLFVLHVASFPSCLRVENPLCVSVPLCLRDVFLLLSSPVCLLPYRQNRIPIQSIHDNAH